MARAGMALSLILSLSLVLAGCWDSREVEELGIIHGIAVESAENGRVRVIFQYINTSVQSGGGGGNNTAFQKPYRNQVVEGDSFYDAIKQLSNETLSRRFFGHNQVLIVSEQFARERGMIEIFDYLIRDPQFRSSVWLVVGRGSDMVSLLDIPGVVTPTPTQRISNLLRNQSRTSTYAPLRLGDFIRVLESSGEQPFTAAIEVRPNASLPDVPGHGVANGQVPEPAYNIAINGTALFKDDKMVGWLNQEESRGLLWLRGQVKQGQIKFSLPEGSKGLMSNEIYTAKTRIKPVVSNGQIIMKVKIDAETVVEEITADVPMDRPEDIKRLEQAQDQAIYREIQAALNAAQKQLQVDVFGFGEAIHREYPQQWQEMKPVWDELFPELQVELEIKSTILHTNLISRSPSSGTE